MMSDEVEMVCGECGTKFCMTRSLYDLRVADHKTFYCPAGHRRYFLGKTKEQEEIEQLKKRIAGLEDDMAQLERISQTCPICGWRSHASPERLWRSLIRHFVRIHGSYRFEEVPELVASTS